MRRKDREITDFDKMLSIIAECDCLRLAFADGLEAYVVPVNFGYETTNHSLVLYFHGACSGRKADLLRIKKRAGFEMDCRHALVTADSACRFSYLYACVMGNGTVEQLEDIEDKRRALRTILAHYSDDAPSDFTDAALAATAVWRLTVSNWSCKVHK